MNIYVVRADFGKYAEDFVKGGYVAIGWLKNDNLENIKTRDEIYPLYKAANPTDTSNVVIGQQVGQIARFLLEIKEGDYVITPAADTDYIYYGTVESGTSYYFNTAQDSCPFVHRRKINYYYGKRRV